MKKLATAICLLVTVSTLAKSTSYECHPVENSHGTKQDFKLTIKNPSIFRAGKLSWTRMEDDFARTYPWIKKNAATTLSNNELVKGLSFYKTDNNSSLIIISSKDELYIQDKLFKGAEEGLVQHYTTNSNLLDTISWSRTTFSCRID